MATVKWIALFVLIQLLNFIGGWIIGIPLVAILVIFGLWTVTKPTQFLGGWVTWLWSNKVDGIYGPYTFTRWHVFYWSGYRNRFNNFQYFPGVSGKGRPDWILHYNLIGPRVFWAGWHEGSGWPVFHPFMKLSDLPT